MLKAANAPHKDRVVSQGVEVTESADRSRGAGVLALAMLWALALTGCVSGPTSDAAGCHVEVTAGGAVYVAGHGVERDRIAERLKASGIRRDTAIRVAVPRDAPKSLLASVARELTGAGYGRVVFVTPRLASASAKKRK
jgi:hypothetical protein